MNKCKLINGLCKYAEMIPYEDGKGEAMCCTKKGWYIYHMNLCPIIKHEIKK